MATPLVQELGFDVVQAIDSLNRLNGSITSFNRRINALSKNLQNFNQSGKTVTRTFQQVGDGANHLDNVTKGARRLTVTWETLVRVVATQLIVKTLRQIQTTFEEASASAIKFQTSIAEINTLAEGSLGSFDQLQASIRQVSDQFNVPLEQVSSGVYETLSSQVADGAEALDFLATAAKFAKTTQTDLGDAVTLLAGTINAFELQTSDAELVASKFFRIIDLGNVRGRELANIFNRVVSQGDQVGVSFDEVGASLTVLTRRGIPARQAMTQISGVLNALTKSTPQTREVFQQLGFETAQQAILSRGLIGVLTDLATAQGGVAEEIAKSFPNVRGLRGALTLGSQATEDFTSDLEALQGTLSTLNQQKFDQIAGIDAQRLSKEFNKFANFLTAEVGPAVNKVTLGVLDLIGGMDSLTFVLRNSEAAVLSLTAATGLYLARTRLAVFQTSALAASLGRLATPIALAGIGHTLADLISSGIDRLNTQHERAAEQAGRELIDTVRKREEERLRIVSQTNAEIFRGLAASLQDASKLYLRETDAIQRSTASFQDNIKSVLTSTVDANRGLLDQLRQIADEVAGIVEASQRRVFNLQSQVGDRQFGRQLRGQDPARQVSALRGRAEDISRSASRLLARAATDADVNRALEQFRRAEGFANQALQLADNLESSASTFASQTLDDINRRQIRAEQQLQRLQQERAQEADVVRQRQQAITDELQAQAKIVAENLDPDKGDAALRDAALRRIEQLRLSQGDASVLDRLGLGNFVAEFQQELVRNPLQLQFSVDREIENIKTRIQQSFDNFEIRIGVDLARQIEDVAGRDLEGPGQFAQAIAAAEKESQQLERVISAREVDAARLEAIRRQFIGLADDLQNPLVQQNKALFSRFGLSSDNAQQAVGIIDQLAGRLRQVGETGRVTAEEVNQIGRELLRLNDIIQEAPQLFGSLLAGPLADDAARLVDQFPKLQDFFAGLQNLEANAVDQERVNQLNALIDSAKVKVDQLKATGDGLFEGGLNNLDRIEQGVSRTLDRLNGGNVPQNFAQNFAHGGTPRGSDKVLAGLTPGEFVVNKRASQQFFSQLQQINAGVRPRFQDGGPVTNVGDITIHVNESATPRLTGREVATALRRELRRGTSRL